MVPCFHTLGSYYVNHALTIKIDSRQKKSKINQILISEISEKLQVIIIGNVDVNFGGMSDSQHYPPILCLFKDE